MKRIICCLMALSLMLSLAGCESSNSYISEAETASSVPGQLAQESQEAPTTTSTDHSSFEVHFINVGQADSSLILCDGEAMLIDGGNADDSSLIYSYLKKLSLNHLEYIVCTHAHEDHVGGLAGALNYASVDKALCPVTNYDSRAFNSFVSYLDKQSVFITIPTAGDSFTLGSAFVQVLAPNTIVENDPNNSSIVLRVEYGTTSFLFTGDAERPEEQKILDSGYTLKSTVLKVGHHGSGSSTTYPFLREVMPEYAVISVGENNSYGHPAEDTISRLRDADVKVFRTDMQGDVICTSDGETVTFTVERNKNANTLIEVEESSTQQNDMHDSYETANCDDQVSIEIEYILNTNTHKFHYPSCSSVSKMKDCNKSFFTGTRNDIIAMGYAPCGQCSP